MELDQHCVHSTLWSLAVLRAILRAILRSAQRSAAVCAKAVTQCVCYAIGDVKLCTTVRPAARPCNGMLAGHMLHDAVLVR